MITESAIWRDELARDLRDLRRRLAKTASSSRADVWERTAAQIEKFTFTSAFISRKLMDNNKLSDDIEQESIAVVKFRPIDSKRTIDFMDRYYFYEHYDVEAPYPASLSGRDLCNALVHSFVFWTGSSTEEGLTFDSIMFNSDRTKDEALFAIALESFMNFIVEVISDEIETFAMNWSSGKARKTKRRGPPMFDLPPALSQ